MFEVPEEATTLSVSVDRVSLPMEEPLLDDRGAVVVDANGKPSVSVAYRMAYCGVWTLHDADGDPLHSVRYGRMPAEGHDPIEETLWGDIEALTVARPTLKPRFTRSAVYSDAQCCAASQVPYRLRLSLPTRCSTTGS